MTAAAPSLPAILGPIRPRPRWREGRLLLIVAAAIVVGSVSLALTGQVADPGESHGLSLANPFHLLVYLGLLGLCHLTLVLSGRRVDEILLPTAGMLGGISLLLMERLPQDQVVQSVGPWELGLGDIQLAWLVLSFGLATALAVTVRSDLWLRLYKYTWAAAGVALLLATFVFGDDVNGQRLSLTIGPVTGQPAELLKVILVVFLAGYLSENRPLLVEESTRVGPIRLPPVPFLAPMAAMWAIALAIVVLQRDLGAALLFFTVFLSLLYIATGRVGYVVVGILLFLAGAYLMYLIFPTVQTRVDIWLDPFKSPNGSGYQIIQSLLRVRARRAARDGARGGPPDGRRQPADPGGPHGLPARRSRRGARDGRDHRDPRPVPRRRRARAADRGVRGRRVPVAAGGGPRPGDRHAGVHHRGGEPEADPAHRDHPAVHQLRRLVPARERHHHRLPAGAVGSRRRAATAAPAARPPGAMDGPVRPAGDAAGGPCADRAGSPGRGGGR